MSPVVRNLTRPLRHTGLAVLSLLLGGTAVLAAEAPSVVDAKLVEQGKYLARAGDCVACHTAPGGKPFAGGLAFKLPMGTIYSTNITPDPTAGLGTYTEADFANAVRRGIAKDGTSLYPAMPFPSYARVSDADIHALYAYFMHGVAPVAVASPQADVTWPLSMRWPLSLWRRMFAPSPDAVVSDAAADPVLARGAYLVEGLGHCGACHTPRGFALQEKALTARDGTAYLSGGAALEGWIPQSLRGDKLTGLGAWSEADIVQFLKTGRNGHGSVFGGMSPVVEDSTQHLSDDDLHAIAHYLKSLPAAEPAREADFHYDDTVAKQLYNGQVTAPGAAAYVDSCAACHRTDGHGYPTVFPPLAGNPVLSGADPDGLIHIVLAGSTLPPTGTAPSAFTMPGFRGRLSNQEAAELVSFIRTSWGNKGAPVTAAEVAKVRGTLPPADKTIAIP
jgi:alcohol dehydrogenase (quinone), cytochrome c subunit